MKYQELTDILKAEVQLKGSSFEKEDFSCFAAGDLMSDILTFEEDTFVLLTSLATEQVIRTADILGTKTVVLVNGKRAQKPMLNLAKQSDVSVLTTPYRMFEACHLLGKALEHEGRIP